jgi:hypothetical protein
MLEDDPGPFFVRDEPPDPDWPAPPGHFARRGAALEAHLEASDHVLGAAARDIASTDDGGLDHTFTATIGAAGDVFELEKDGDGDQTPDVLIVNGTPTEELRAQVKSFLPPSTTPITTDFADRPPPPQGRPSDDTDPAPRTETPDYGV